MNFLQACTRKSDTVELRERSSDSPSGKEGQSLYEHSVVQQALAALLAQARTCLYSCSLSALYPLKANGFALAAPRNL